MRFRMAKYRLTCTKCGWHTKPQYSPLDCVREKERAHRTGIVHAPDRDAHEAAFGMYCPKCDGKVIQEHRWFP